MDSLEDSDASSTEDSKENQEKNEGEKKRQEQNDVQEKVDSEENSEKLDSETESKPDDSKKGISQQSQASQEGEPIQYRSYQFYQDTPVKSDTEEHATSNEDSMVQRLRSESLYVGVTPNEISPVGYSRRQIAVIFVGLCLGMFISSLDNSIVATALPAIGSEFGRLDLYAWVSTSYLLTSTAIIPLTGKLSDIFGRKWVFMFFIVVFLVGSILCGAAPDMITLIIFRGIQGIGGGALMSLAMVIIGDIVTVRERGRWTGLMGMVFVVSSVLGPVLGGVITDNISWRWIFYINIPIGVITIVVIFFSLKLPKRKNQQPMLKAIKSIDFFGTFSVVVGTVLVLLGASLGGSTYDWNSAAIILFFILGGLILIAFVFIELYVQQPIINMKVFLIRNVVIADALAALLGFILFGCLTFLPIYFQTIRGDSPTISGLKMLPLVGGLLIFSTISGLLITKTGYFSPWPMIGCAFLALGTGLFGGLIDIDTNVYLVSLYLFILGTGIGWCLQTLTVIVQNSVTIQDMASATSTNGFVRTMGGVLGITVFGAVINNYLKNNLPPAVLPAVNGGYKVIQQLPDPLLVWSTYVQSIRIIFLISTGVGILALFVSFGMKHYKISKSTGAAPPMEV